MRKQIAVLGLAVVLITLITPLVSLACGGGGGPITVTAPETRLAVGKLATVAVNKEDLLNLRADPELNGKWLASLKQGTKITVVDGPMKSTYGYNYWKVITDDTKLTGWVAEGADGAYWVNPLN